jgi:hypothetical protein
MYYNRYELQLRVNLFFSAGILAGAFSGVGYPYLPVYLYLRTNSFLRMRLPTWPVLLVTAADAGSSFLKGSSLALSLSSHSGSFPTGLMLPDS